MANDSMHPELRWTLEDVAHQARRLRRMRCAWRFALATLGLTALATALFALNIGMQWPRVVGIGYAVAVLAAAVRWLIWPMRKRITLEQVARYIDEHHPELQDRIVSAVDFADKPQEGASPWIVDKFMSETVPLVQKTSFDDVTRGSRAQALFMVATVLFLGAAIVIVEFRGYWAPAWNWVLPAEIAKRVAPLPFTVEPGNARVRKGDNQMIWVRSDQPDRTVTIHYRIGDGVWQEATARASQADRVYFHEFQNVQDDIDYRVRFGRRDSEDYALTAWLPPEVTQINLTYNFPEYLEREPREEPNGGHIAAVEGTTVDVAVLVNKKIAKAAMVLDTGERIPMSETGEGVWSAPYTVVENAKYHVALEDLDGEGSEFNPEYRITAQQDLPPKVAIDFPRDDQDVTNIDSIPFTFAVSDDFGFNEFGLQYEVAGREPVRLPLTTEEGMSLSAEGYHELMLEEMNLEVGDFITWTVWARDAKPDRSEWEEVGDPYFLEIRPFERTFREAISDAGGQQGGGGQGSELDQAQKDILIATWNLRRDIRFHDEDSFSDDRNEIVKVQEELLNQVSMGGGGGENAAAEKDIAALKEAMARSAAALRRAAMPDPRGALSEATSAQQQANRLIRRLESTDAQVTQQQQGGGGGGAGMSQDAELQELEMARNRNFYENERLTQQQQQATDDLLKRLKELAQRQQSVNDELAKLISEMQNASPEEQEKLQRRLERLKEEMQQNMERLDQARQDMANQPMNTGETQEAMDQLDWARRQMNETIEQMDQQDMQRARASAARALRSMDDVAEQLRQLNRSAASERMRNLQEKMEQLVEEQEGNEERTREARERHESPDFAEVQKNEAAKEELLESKEAMEREFLEMMNDASDLAERSRESQELMARELGDWLRETAKEGLIEELSESKDLAKYDLWDRALEEEVSLAEKFRAASRRLDEVAESLVEDDLAAMQQAMRRLDELMERPEMQESAQGSEDGEGQAGTPDPEGEQQGRVPAQQGEDPEGEPGAAPGEEGERTRVAQRTGEEGEQPSEGQQRGEQSGEQQGEQSGEQQGEQSGEQQGEEEGQGQGQSQQENADAQSAQNQQQARGGGGGDQRAGANAGGPDDMMRDFAEQGYQQWLEQLRDAEDLLPDQSPMREQIVDIRENIEMMRNNWRARALAPQWDLFLEMVARPLEDTADQLQREIERQLGEEEYVIADDGAVPERYKRRVADYFKSISEAEGIQ